MMERSVIFLALIYFLGTSAQLSPGCRWDLNLDLPKLDPLYYKSSSPSSLIIPGPSGLTLQENENMTLICIGKTNTIFGTGKQELTLPCVADSKLLYNNIQYPLNNFYCASNSLSDVLITKNYCADGRGIVMNLGFNSSKGFATQVEVCYDTINEAAIYAVNTIYGKSIAHAEIESDRPSFRNQGLTFGTTTANQYKQTEQLKRFTLLLGSNQAAKYLTTTSFLARGHLAPDADFLLGGWSTATYFYVNAAPEWQVVNAGNWLRVENIARDVADLRQEDLTIYTGTFGVLQLPNESGTLTNIYLLDIEKLPVPKWYWKIIYSPATQQGIAFVTLNNPHVDNISDGELLCLNVCSETNWTKPEWNDFTKGFTYCCDVNLLIGRVQSMSPLPISGRLVGPV